jgi:hypothetical protein
MSISTKDIPTSGGTGSIPKVIEPGNKVVKVNKVYLDRAPWSETGYNLMFDCESPELGPAFEGFWRDKSDESKGRHAGQVGRIRSSRWLYEDKTIQSGGEDIEISRDLEIIKFLKHFCEATGCSDWFNKADGQHDTIEQFIEKFNLDMPFKDKFLNACVCGKQYENKEGYMNHDLFFPKFTRNGLPFESEEVEEHASRVYKFNEKDHIIPMKPKAVSGFQGGADPANGTDEKFELPD